MNRMLIAGAAVLALGTALLVPAVAQPSGAAAAAARKANYKEIGGAFKTVKDELRSGQPDMNSVRPAARDIAQRAAVTLKQFPRGSAPGPGVNTRAKALVWSDRAGFTKLQNEMVAAANALHAVAGRGDVAAMRAARDRLGKSCKACHDRFRVPS